MVLYWEWLRDNDPATSARDAMFHEDDCRAMALVGRALSEGALQPGAVGK